MRTKYFLNLIVMLSVLSASGCKKTDYIKPDVSTVDVSIITPVSATCRAIVITNGTSVISEKGICWNNEQSASVSDFKTTEIKAEDVKNFSGNITGLLSNTTYYVRAYAVSPAGVTYGNELSFTTPSDHSGEQGTVTDFEGNVYKTIGIGSQIWTAENMRATLLNDGTEITLGQCYRCWSFLSSPGYCWYDNYKPNQNTYGALYNWYTVKSMKLCPSGWHMPGSDEWEVLTSYLGGSEVAGGKLIESGKSGFGALSGGYRGDLAAFINFGETGAYWTSSSASPEKAIYFSVGSDSQEITSETFAIGWGASVRCIKN